MATEDEKNKAGGKLKPGATPAQRARNGARVANKAAKNAQKPAAPKKK